MHGGRFTDQPGRLHAAHKSTRAAAMCALAEQPGAGRHKSPRACFCDSSQATPSAPSRPRYSRGPPLGGNIQLTDASVPSASSTRPRRPPPASYQEICSAPGMHGRRFTDQPQHWCAANKRKRAAVMCALAVQQGAGRRKSPRACLCDSSQTTPSAPSRPRYSRGPPLGGNIQLTDTSGTSCSE